MSLPHLHDQSAWFFDQSPKAFDWSGPGALGSEMQLAGHYLSNVFLTLEVTNTNHNFLLLCFPFASITDPTLILEMLSVFLVPAFLFTRIPRSLLLQHRQAFHGLNISAFKQNVFDSILQTPAFKSMYVNAASCNIERRYIRH